MWYSVGGCIKTYRRNKSYFRSMYQYVHVTEAIDVADDGGGVSMFDKVYNFWFQFGIAM